MGEVTFGSVSAPQILNPPYLTLSCSIGVSTGIDDHIGANLIKSLIRRTASSWFMFSMLNGRGSSYVKKCPLEVNVVSLFSEIGLCKGDK